MDQHPVNSASSDNSTSSNETIKLPDYAGHKDFTQWVLSSRANMCCLCRNGTIDYINPIGVHLLQGTEVSEFVGQKLETFVDPAYAELISLGLDAFAEEEAGIPLKLITLNNNRLDVVMTVAALPSEPSENAVFLVECNNITQLLQSSESARRREQRTANILQTISDGVLITDEMGTIQSTNPAAETIFGYKARELIGKNISMLVPEPHQSVHDAYLADFQKSGISNVVGNLRELIALHKDGIEFHIEITINELKQDDGRKTFTSIFRDVTERKRRDDQISHLAHHDALTGLPNRLLFEDRLEHALNQARRNKETVALLFIDLDKFKPINDTLGHEAGDAVLKEVARRLLNCSRASDTVARVGGDEFVVILAPISRRDGAGKVAKSMIKALMAPVVEVAQDCTIGASIGISIFPDDATDPQTLMSCADETMYRVKKAGRNNYLYFDDKSAST